MAQLGGQFGRHNRIGTTDLLMGLSRRPRGHTLRNKCTHPFLCKRHGYPRGKSNRPRGCRKIFAQIWCFLVGCHWRFFGVLACLGMRGGGCVIIMRINHLTWRLTRHAPPAARLSRLFSFTRVEGDGGDVGFVCQVAPCPCECGTPYLSASWQGLDLPNPTRLNASNPEMGHMGA